MQELAAGSIVRHRVLGQGKVVAAEETALHVFFPASQSRFAVKLRLPAAIPLMSQDDLEPDPWLEGLTSFAMDAASGRYALDAHFVHHDDAVAAFLAERPGGFRADPATGSSGARQGRGALWRRACEEWEACLGGGQAARLQEERDHDELARRALRVAAHAAPIPGMFEAGVLEEALAPGDEVRDFLDALLGYLAVPTPSAARFDRLCAASQALGVPADAAWPMATFFPFVAMPTRHLVLLPRSVCTAASRLGCDIRYQPVPNRPTHSRLHGLATRLLEKLAPSGARDLVDVECFLHATGARRSPTTTRTSRRASPSTTKGARTTPRRKR